LLEADFFAGVFLTVFFFDDVFVIVTSQLSSED